MDLDDVIAGTAVWSDEAPGLFAFEEMGEGHEDRPTRLSPYTLWAAKTGRWRDPTAQSRRIWQRRLGCAIAAEATREIGYSYQEVGQTALKDSIAHWVHGIAETPRGPALVLPLLIGTEDWDREWRKQGERPPDWALVESLAAMAATGQKRTLIAVLIGLEKARTFETERDGDLTQIVRAQTRWFFETHVTRDAPPPVDPTRDAQALRAVLAETAEGKTINLTGNAEAERFIQEWNEAEPIARREADRVEKAKTGLLNLVGDAERALVGQWQLDSHTVPARQVSYERRAYRVLRLSASDKERKKGKTA